MCNFYNSTVAKLRCCVYVILCCAVYISSVSLRSYVVFWCLDVIIALKYYTKESRAVFTFAIHICITNS